MPAVGQLSQEYREEYRAEQEKTRKKAEAQQKKLEEQRRRDEERAERERQRWAEREQARQEQSQRDAEAAAWKSKVTQAAWEVSEDGVVEGSYPTLNAMAGFYRMLAVLVAMLGALCIILALVVGMQQSPALAVVAAAITIAWVGFTIFLLLLASESIKLMVNAANDMRVAKALLKRIAYPPENAVQ
ncbi:MAG: hypothetical protein LLG00_16155 [Planctomycetaceae bacterium]|nr:hypothetical protein [Planctomycetaceae bacterium]